MKTFVAILLWCCVALTASASSTIDTTNRYAYGGNLGWIDWVADTNNGAVIGNYVCSGYLYSANTGWINLGSGSPTNGINYQNLSTNDFGVNQDGLGNLRGYAYGANIGWINFETNGAPKVNLLTGTLSGSIWSANCGWISLSNAFAHVQTDTIQPGALSTNGLPVAWLLTYYGTTNVNPTADPTGKGNTIAADYVAGTIPTNASSVLKVTTNNVTSGGTGVTLSWESVPTRIYFIQQETGLTPPAWGDSGLGLIAPTGNSTTVSFSTSAASIRFYRVGVELPLSP